MLRKVSQMGLQSRVSTLPLIIRRRVDAQSGGVPLSFRGAFHNRSCSSTFVWRMTFTEAGTHRGSMRQGRSDPWFARRVHESRRLRQYVALCQRVPRRVAEALLSSLQFLPTVHQLLLRSPNARDCPYQNGCDHEQVEAERPPQS